MYYKLRSPLYYKLIQFNCKNKLFKDEKGVYTLQKGKYCLLVLFLNDKQCIARAHYCIVFLKPIFPLMPHFRLQDFIMQFEKTIKKL